MSGEFLCLQAVQKLIHIVLKGDLEIACIAGAWKLWAQEIERGARGRHPRRPLRRLT